MGINLEGGRPLCSRRHPGFDFPGPREGSRRNHGRHHGHRQYPCHQRFSVCLRVFDCRGYRQRAHRSYQQSALSIPHRVGTRTLSSDFHSQWARSPADRGYFSTGCWNGTRMSPRLRWRKIVSGFMLTMTGACALVSVSALFLILGYLVYHGGTSISWNFFTKLPAPVGESGGGMANAILGSAKLLLLASLVGVPIGFFGAIYLAEFSGATSAFIVRYAAALLNGVPSIVIGIFAYSLVVLPFKHFSALSRTRSAKPPWPLAPASREPSQPSSCRPLIAASLPPFCWPSPVSLVKPPRSFSLPLAIAFGAKAGISPRLRFPR